MVKEDTFSKPKKEESEVPEQLLSDSSSVIEPPPPKKVVNEAERAERYKEMNQEAAEKRQQFATEGRR